MIVLSLLFSSVTACDPAAPSSSPGATEVDSAALAARLEALEAEVEALRGALDAAGAPYTDADAIAAVQNPNPGSSPDGANLQSLWSQTVYGYQWLESSRWTMDNRSLPPGSSPRHELVQIFHETPECLEGSTFADCNATSGIKIYANGPRITDNNWSSSGFAAAAVRPYHTHASGLYLVSFGRASQVTDISAPLIPPSGIHLEPHGAHQALRIDGSLNAGENIRVDVSGGGTGLAIYADTTPSDTCADLGWACAETWPLSVRGGTIRLEDTVVERSLSDLRGAGAYTLATASLGLEPFREWHTAAATGLPVHCVWNSRVSAEDAVIRLQPYTTSPDLPVAHSYALVSVWGPGHAPAGCLESQLIFTDAVGVYGLGPPDPSLSAYGGFSVTILGPDPEEPLDPGDWGQTDRPTFLYEVLLPLGP